MSLPILPVARPSLSESSVTVSDEDSPGEPEAGGASMRSLAIPDAADLAAPAPRALPAADSEATVPDGSGLHGWPALSAMRGAAEFLWHGTGRVINCSTFVLLSKASPSQLRIAASVVTGVAAGHCGYRLVVARTGSSPCARALAAAAGLVTGFAAGAATYCGSGYPGLMVAAASVIGAAASYVQHQSRSPGQAPDSADAAPPAFVVATCGASIAVAVCVPALRTRDVGKLGRRTLALLAESATVELFKGATERAIPGADRHRLCFERRLKTAMIGMLPYACASVVFGGVLGNLLRAQMNSERFDSYLVPMLVGALASVVKGAVNTALVYCGGEWSPCCTVHPEGLRAAEGIRRPPAGSTLEKTALRFAIASARDVIYLSLIDSGLNDIAAACLAHALYAFFAQHRDLIHDMMQGEGWTEPQVVARNEIASA